MYTGIECDCEDEPKVWKSSVTANAFLKPIVRYIEYVPKIFVLKLTVLYPFIARV